MFPEHFETSKMDRSMQLVGRPLATHAPANFPACHKGFLLWPDLSLVLPGRALLTAVYFAAMLPLRPQETWSIALLSKTQMVKPGNVDLVMDSILPLYNYPTEEGEVAIPLNVTLEEGQILGLLHPCSGPPMPVGLGNNASNLVTLDAFPNPGQQVPASFLTSENVQVPGQPAWAFGYETLSPKKVERSGGAVQILTSVKSDAKCIKEEPLLGSLREYSQSCSSWALRYPVYVLHTAKMEGVDGEEMLQWMEDVRNASHSRLPIAFLDVSDEFPSVQFGDGRVKLDQHDLLWMDLTRSNSAYLRQHRPRRFNTGYRHMCRFQTSTVLTLDVFAHVRYLLHMDADATLLCTSSLDPFEEMAREEYAYGLFEVGVEDPQFAEGWTEFLEEYIYFARGGSASTKGVIVYTGSSVHKGFDRHAAAIQC